NACQALQLDYGLSQFLFIGKKMESQRARHTEAAIIGGAAAKADDDFIRAAFGRIQNYFADAEGGRANRIAFSFGKPSYPSGFTHLHHRKFFLLDPPVARGDLPAE